MSIRVHSKVVSAAMALVVLCGIRGLHRYHQRRRGGVRQQFKRTGDSHRFVSCIRWHRLVEFQLN